jgi:hypothetical protein
VKFSDNEMCHVKFGESMDQPHSPNVFQDLQFTTRVQGILQTNDRGYSMVNVLVSLTPVLLHRQGPKRLGGHQFPRTQRRTHIQAAHLGRLGGPAPQRFNETMAVP